MSDSIRRQKEPSNRLKVLFVNILDPAKFMTAQDFSNLEFPTILLSVILKQSAPQDWHPTRLENGLRDLGA
jgi:hypothetical protein